MTFDLTSLKEYKLHVRSSQAVVSKRVKRLNNWTAHNNFIYVHAPPPLTDYSAILYTQKLKDYCSRDTLGCFQHMGLGHTHTHTHIHTHAVKYAHTHTHTQLHMHTDKCTC